MATNRTRLEVRERRPGSGPDWEECTAGLDLQLKPDCNETDTAPVTMTAHESCESCLRAGLNFRIRVGIANGAMDLEEYTRNGLAAFRFRNIKCIRVRSPCVLHERLCVKGPPCLYTCTSKRLWLRFKIGSQ